VVTIGVSWDFLLFVLAVSLRDVDPKTWMAMLDDPPGERSTSSWTAVLKSRAST
jgi:hypothetical protein